MDKIKKWWDHIAPGLSIYISIGKYGGFRIQWDKGPRIVLGWIAIAIFNQDVDVQLRYMFKEMTRLKDELETLKGAHNN